MKISYWTYTYYSYRIKQSLPVTYFEIINVHISMKKKKLFCSSRGVQPDMEKQTAMISVKSGPTPFHWRSSTWPLFCPGIHTSLIFMNGKMKGMWLPVEEMVASLRTRHTMEITRDFSSEPLQNSLESRRFYFENCLTVSQSKCIIFLQNFHEC